MSGEPKIAFVRWLSGHPGRKPSDFEPIIKEAEFAFRCRAAFAPVCADIGGVKAMERHVKNLELGLCCGWPVLESAAARSLRTWLDAVLLHHPWRNAVDWRNSEAQETLFRYCREDRPAAQADEEDRQVIAAAGLADAFNLACTFFSWRDVQSAVLGAWLGGAVLVDERGYLVADWKKAFARTLASRFKSLY